MHSLLRNLIALALVLLLFSCQRGDQHHFTSDVDSIPLHPINFYYGIHQHFYDGEFPLSTLSRSNDSLLFYDFGSTAWRGIAIAADDSGNPVRSHCVLNTDSILLFYMNEVRVIDHNGNVLGKKAIANPDSSSHPVMLNLSDLSLKNIPNCGAHGVEVSQMGFENSYWEKEFFEYPISSFYHYSSNEFSILPVHYPKIYTQECFGDYIYHWTAFNGKEQLVTGFQTSSELCIYNLLTGKAIYKNAKSMHQEKPIEAFDIKYKDDFNRIYDYHIENDEYGEIVYDPFRGCYYRFFTKGTPLQNEHGEFVTAWSRPNYLMVLNEQLDVIQEIPLDPHLNIQSCFVIPKGIHIKITTDSTYNEKKYYYFKVYSILD